MTGAVRVQLSRAKGWRMPPNTVSVARPGPFGNPSYVIRDEVRDAGNDDGSVMGPWFCGLNVLDRPHLIGFWFGSRREALEKAVALFRWRVTESQLPKDRALQARLPELRGRNLGCWCAPGQPCHADILLEVANR